MLRPQGSNLQACGGCDVQLRSSSAPISSSRAWCKKISTLILNINIYVRDAHTGQLITVDECRFSRQYR